MAIRDAVPLQELHENSDKGAFTIGGKFLGCAIERALVAWLCRWQWLLVCGLGILWITDTALGFGGANRLPAVQAPNPIGRLFSYYNPLHY